ncbi:MAG TPA: DUF6261 family protein [Paludibacter sp.]
MEKLIVPSLLSVSDGILMAERFKKTIQALIETDPKIRNLYNGFISVYKRLVKNQKNGGKSPLTGELLQLGKRRSRARIAFRDILYGISVSLIEEPSAKASKLYAIFEKHGATADKPGYKKVTAVLISLISEFDLPANQVLLKELNLLPFYESLKTANEIFDSVSKQKSDEKSILAADSEPATAILEELIAAMEDLLAMIQLNYQIDKETYGEIYNQLVTYINEINTTARARKTRKQNSNEAELKPEPV